MKGLWAHVGEFIGMINWWVATKMLVIVLLGVGTLVWLIRWFL